MTIRPEKGATRLFRVPASGHWNAEDAIDAGIVMRELDSNLGHLCEEGVRHAAWDPGTNLTSFTDNAFVSYASAQAEDVPVPASGQVASGWQMIAWDSRSARRFGPFAMVPDVGNRPVDAGPRTIRVVAELDVPVGLSNSRAVVVLTRSQSPSEIMSGLYLAAAESYPLSTGAQTYRWDLEPGTRGYVEGRPPDRMLPSAPTTTNAAASTPVRTFWVWVGFVLTEPAGALALEVLSLSAYESRE